MNPFLQFVRDIEAGIDAAKTIEVARRLSPPQSGPVVLLLSPHPDDECITSLLPLRLMREAGRRIVNVPVTYGSDLHRRSGRLAELEAACGYLGFENQRTTADLRPLGVDAVVSAIEELQPETIFMPHAADWNSGHIATHKLAVEAMKMLGTAFSCNVVETEFWQPMSAPNLLVEGDAELVADLVAATALHAVEVARNPYHLRLPAWMQDNVRRGSERVGGEGGPAFDYSFAAIYRFRRWESGGFVDTFRQGVGISIHDNPASFFA